MKESPHNWVVFHPQIYPKQPGFFIDQVTLDLGLGDYELEPGWNQVSPTSCSAGRPHSSQSHGSRNHLRGFPGHYMGLLRDHAWRIIPGLVSS